MKAILELSEMPKCCSECIIMVRTYASESPWCKVTKKDCPNCNKERNSDCPLKEV